MSDYSVAVIGSGPGGYVAAIRAAQQGASVCLVEQSEIGGTCLNRGCIPTKALLAISHLWSKIREAEKFGIEISASSLNFVKAMERKNKIVEGLRGGIQALFKKNGVTVKNGRGRISRNHEITVESPAGNETFTADKIIIATGSEPRKFPFIPFDGKNIMTSDDILFNTALPKTMLILGGGVIGCEFATLYSELGVSCTIVELMPQLIPGTDEDVSKELLKALKKKKVSVHLGAKLEDVKYENGAVTAKLTREGAEPQTLSAEQLLVSVGRSLCIANIGIEEAGLGIGVKLNENPKYVLIDEHCRTSNPDIYAIGDITGKWWLAHVASKQGIVAADHATGHHSHINYDVVPACIFTHPEIGLVGLTAKDAEKRGLQVKTSVFQYRALGKAHAEGEIDGFYKLVGDAQSGLLLGAQIIGAHATDIIAEIAIALEKKATVSDLAHTIHAHPTLAEGVMEAAEAWCGKAIHG